MENFIDAKSMITPGLAGTLVMLITNALANSFSLSGKWVALVLSFVCGLLVFADKKLSVPPRIALYVLNSLIVFAMAVGANGIGSAASTGPSGGTKGAEVAVEPTRAPAATPARHPTAVPPVRVETPRTFFKPWLQRGAVEVQRPR